MQGVAGVTVWGAAEVHVQGAQGGLAVRACAWRLGPVLRSLSGSRGVHTGLRQHVGSRRC